MVQRLVYRRRNGYNTRSNRVKIVKTPGGNLRYLHVKKTAGTPKCGDCGRQLQGVPALRPRKYATLSKRQKTVNRAYGGSRCATCVRNRILRAFLIEECKIVKRVMKSKKLDKKPVVSAEPAKSKASDSKNTTSSSKQPAAAPRKANK